MGKTGWSFRQKARGRSYWRSTVLVIVDQRDEWHSMIALDQERAHDRQLVGEETGVFSVDTDGARGEVQM